MTGRHARGRRPRPPEPRRIGVELEFQLIGPTGPLDARALLPTLPLDGRRLDPGDPHAVRCRWGGVVTADGREAEIATPPVTVDREGLAPTVALAAAGTAALADAVAGRAELRGYSTHLNVEVDDRAAPRLARTVVERMAVPMMLLLDRRDSPGLLVRPRHRRLELGGEHQSGERLAACLAMAVGVTMVAERSLADRRWRRRSAPPALDVRAVPSPQRFGWYVDRRALGPDLYTDGRAARLRTAAGSTVTAGDVLASTWAVARSEVAAFVGPRELSFVDARVDGRLPLPCEDPAAAEPRPVEAERAPSVADVLCTRRRGGIVVTAVAATWHAVSLRAQRGDASRWIDVPGDRIDAFLAALDRGELDGWLHELLAVGT